MLEENPLLQGMFAILTSRTVLDGNISKLSRDTESYGQTGHFCGSLLAMSYVTNSLLRKKR
jgi:hypothetical protein